MERGGFRFAMVVGKAVACPAAWIGDELWTTEVRWVSWDNLNLWMEDAEARGVLKRGCGGVGCRRGLWVLFWMEACDALKEELATLLQELKGVWDVVFCGNDIEGVSSAYTGCGRFKNEAEETGGGWGSELFWPWFKYKWYGSGDFRTCGLVILKIAPFRIDWFCWSMC